MVYATLRSSSSSSSPPRHAAVPPSASMGPGPVPVVNVHHPVAVHPLPARGPPQPRSPGHGWTKAPGASMSHMVKLGFYMFFCFYMFFLPPGK